MIYAFYDKNVGLKMFIIFLVIAIVSLIIKIIYEKIIKSPFHYPYCKIRINISGKKMQNIDRFIDQYLIENGIDEFKTHYEKVCAWKNTCKGKISKSVFKKHRKNQFLKCLDDDSMFVFLIERDQTRYTQKNYVRYPYIVAVVVEKYYFNYEYIANRYKLLEEIDFECTMEEYNSKNQRRMMTPELRNEIAFRDNYTCQMCGKYMPDGVGLHIDHIIPISAGGKSIPSNLQVLCSKCNGSKSKKY